MSGISEVLRNGIAAAQAREFDQARPLLEEATAAAPDDPIGWFWLAIASPTGGAAIPCLRRVLEIDPSHEQSKAALAKLLMAEAVSVATAGNRAEARALVAEAARIIPGEQAVWLRLAATTDDPDERIYALRQAMAISPDDGVRTRLRQALLWRGLSRNADRAVARASFREAAELDPTDPRVWQALASLADSPAEAVEALRELLRVAPNHPNGRGALRNAMAADAYALAGAELVDEACRRWREIMDLTGGDVETWLGIAATTSDQEEAERAVKTAFKLKPTDERAAAAMERLRRSKIDPATALPPSNAFGRFEASAFDCAALEPPDDALPPIDSSLEALFAPLAMPEVEAPSEIVLDLSQIPEPPPSEIVLDPSQTPEPAPSEIVLDLSQITEPPSETVSALLQPAEPPSETVPAVLQTAEPPSETVPALLQTAAPQSESAPVIPAAVEPRPDIAVAAVAPIPEAPAIVPPPVPPAAAAPASMAATGVERSSPDASRRTVMVVDDSPTIRQILGLTLKRAGYTVVAEPDGEAAIERLTQMVPDLILLDIAMPKLDGYEVCKRIKLDPRTAGVPIVMLSGKGAFFDKVKGHMAGATEYLTKPFETPAVLAVVNGFCPPSDEALHG